MVGEAQSKELFDCMQTMDHEKAALSVANEVAVDLSIAEVSMLISSFDRVTSYRSAEIEDISVFVSRFCGLAATH